MELDVPALKEILGKAPHLLAVVVCISGIFRSGKSFILGLFLQYLQYEGEDNWIDKPVQHSFKYSNSDEGVTSGVWMWSEPFIRKDKKGRQVAIYLMDSQGWHDAKSDLRDNAKFFGLSSLLSSVMILNIEKRISETDLQYLQNFSFNAKLINELKKEEPFQKLVILIRDWNSKDNFPFGFYDNNETINGKDFIGKKLKPQSDQTFEGQKLRELILSTYENVSACLLPYPGQIVGENKYDSSLMNRGFRSTLEVFVPALFNSEKLLPRKYQGKDLSGQELFSLALKWTEDFKTKSNPNISSYLSNDESKYYMAVQTGLEYFYEKMRIAIPLAKTVPEIEKLILEQKYDQDVNLDKFNYTSIFRQLSAESVRLVETNGRLTDPRKRTEFAKKLSMELLRAQEVYTQQLESKINRIRLTEEMNRREKELDDMKRNNPANELIPFLLEQLKADRKEAKQKMGMMEQTMNKQMEMMRECITELKPPPPKKKNGWCTTQ